MRIILDQCLFSDFYLMFNAISLVAKAESPENWFEIHHLLNLCSGYEVLSDELYIRTMFDSVEEIKRCKVDILQKEISMKFIAVYIVAQIIITLLQAY